MKKIESMARASYFATDAKKSIAMDIYTYGYKCGFTEALNKVNEALGDYPNNLQRIDAICNLLDEYLKEDENGNK